MIDYQSLTYLGIATVLLMAATGLFIVMLRRGSSFSRPVQLTIWAGIGALIGIVIGMADKDLTMLTGALLGAFWGLLLALLVTTGWTLQE